MVSNTNFSDITNRMRIPTLSSQQTEDENSIEDYTKGV
jgi:hypothetical protein